MKKLSIITVCLNSVNWIEKSILSVINQTFTDYEYIIIDGLSTDGTMDVINKYRDKIDITLSEKDNGIYSAMNKGINLSSGEYTYFLNSDDYLCDDKVLELIFSKGLSADIIYGDLYCIGNIYNRVIKKPVLAKAWTETNDINLYIRTIFHPSSFIKRELFLKYGLYDESFKIAGDYDFFVKTIVKYKVSTKYIPVAFAYFSLTGISSEYNGKDVIDTRERETEAVRKRYWTDNEFKLLKEIAEFRQSSPILVYNEIKKISYNI